MEDKIIILKEDGSPDKKAMAWSKAKEVFGKVVDTTKKGVTWTLQTINDNKEAIAIAAPIVLAIANRTKQHGYQKAEEWYDRSSHTWWQLKRHMTNSEMAEYDRRRKMGEDPYDILRSMRLLK